MHEKINLSTKLISETYQKLKKSLPLICTTIVLSACVVIPDRKITEEYVDDVSITASVIDKLLQDSQLKMFRIRVETFQKQVHLDGLVDSQKEYVRAEQIARNVKGVESVKNHLVVRHIKKW